MEQIKIPQKVVIANNVKPNIANVNATSLGKKLLRELIMMRILIVKRVELPPQM